MVDALEVDTLKLIERFCQPFYEGEENEIGRQQQRCRLLKLKGSGVHPAVGTGCEDRRVGVIGWTGRKYRRNVHNLYNRGNDPTCDTCIFVHVPMLLDLQGGSCMVALKGYQHPNANFGDQDIPVFDKNCSNGYSVTSQLGKRRLKKGDVVVYNLQFWGAGYPVVQNLRLLRT